MDKKALTKKRKRKEGKKKKKGRIYPKVILSLSLTLFFALGLTVAFRPTADARQTTTTAAASAFQRLANCQSRRRSYIYIYM